MNAPPPNVHEWSRRTTVTSSWEEVQRGVVQPSDVRRDPVETPELHVVPGGSVEAELIYPKLHWEKNCEAGPHLDWARFPLDVVCVRRTRPANFLVDDPEYQRTAHAYPLVRASCVVCDERHAIVAVFVTEGALASLGPLAEQARAALGEAARDLKPRRSFAIGGNYNSSDPEFYAKRALNMQQRMNGTIWNDGLQTYTIPRTKWGGMCFTQYVRRRPGSDLTAFALPYVGMYAVERAVVPAIAQARLRLLVDAQLPSAFPGLPREAMPATMVGISDNFAVKTHVDSCVSSVTETILWANRDVPNARFAVTSVQIAFDIGARPCILFQCGREMHGTVPGTQGSCGLVLISKRMTLQRYERGAYTDRIVA
jgi:hypothetical protein